MSEIVIYEDGMVSLEATVEKDTLWLSQQQISGLFGVTVPTINEHIKNIYRENELVQDSTIRKFLIVRKEEKREVRRNIEHYSLGAIISVGYRVNSKKATIFRIWATNILKAHLIQGYTLNQKRLQQKGLEEFNQAIALLQTTIGQENLACDLANAA